MNAYPLSNTASGSITITGNYSANGKIWLSVIEYSNVSSSRWSMLFPAYLSSGCTHLDTRQQKRRISGYQDL